MYTIFIHTWYIFAGTGFFEDLCLGRARRAAEGAEAKRGKLHGSQGKVRQARQGIQRVRRKAQAGTHFQ